MSWRLDVLQRQRILLLCQRTIRYIRPSDAGMRQNERLSHEGQLCGGHGLRQRTSPSTPVSTAFIKSDTFFYLDILQHRSLIVFLNPCVFGNYSNYGRRFNVAILRKHLRDIFHNAYFKGNAVFFVKKLISKIGHPNWRWCPVIYVNLSYAVYAYIRKMENSEKADIIVNCIIMQKSHMRGSGRKCGALKKYVA